MSIPSAGGAAEEAAAQNESETVVAALLADRPEAVAAVAGWARTIAVHRVWHFETPEDIVQETLLAVVRNLRRGGYVPGDFRAYVRRIAKNRCVSRFRRYRTRGPQASLDEGEVQTVASKEGARTLEDRLTVEEILARLDDTCRRLITLAYFEGLSRRQIGLRLGISETAAKVRLFRCLERAREIERPDSGNSSHVS